MPKKRQYGWIEEAEARKLCRSALLQRADGEPQFAVISTEPGLMWRGRIRALFGLDELEPCPQRYPRPADRRLPAASRGTVD